jgi:hypothetical protein
MKKAICFAAILLCLAACKSKPLDATKGNQLFGSTGYPHTPMIDEGDTIAGLMECTDVIMENPFGSHGGGATLLPHRMIFASFRNQSWDAVSAGDVRVNGVSNRRAVIPTSLHHFSYDIPDFGIMHHWQVSPDWTGIIPAIDDSVLAPKEFRITLPRPIADTISQSRGFTCTYGDSGTDSVDLVIWFDSVFNNIVDHSSTPHSSAKPITIRMANTGSSYVDGSYLSSLPNSGAVQLWLTATRKKDLIIAGRVYRIKEISGGRTSCFIKY